MKCPYCNNLDTKVVDSRAMEESSAIRRRRECENCEERFTTYERVENIPLAVIKRDRTREIFSRAKVLDGIVKSCSKRPVSMEQIESIANEIENTVINLGTKEIESNKIGEIVMDKLKAVDEVSYVRFASVYREFKDIDTFMQELSKLLHEKEKTKDDYK